MAGCSYATLEPVVRPCPTLPLAPGSMLVAPVSCGAMLFPSGDGTGADLWIGNDRFRAVLRNPQASLSLAGLGGVTIVDAAAWGRNDTVYEIAALVGGGWLDVDEMHLTDRAIVASGTVRSLPAHTSTLEGERRTVSWHTAPGDPWLYADGADGFWIQTSVAATRVDGWLLTDPGVIGHDGTITEDLGGAVVIGGATKLLIGDTSTAWSERPGPLLHLSGLSVGAAQIELLRDGLLVGRLPVAEDGSFDSMVSATVNGVRAVATGSASSPPSVPGEDLVLTLGAEGTLALRPVWPQGVRQRPVLVSWTSGDGRHGSARIPPDGAELPLGGGTLDVVVTAGPVWARRSLRVDLHPDAPTALQVAMVPLINADARVLGSLVWEGGRARTQAVAETERARDAVASGLEYAVFTAYDDVSRGAGFLNDTAWLRMEDGATLTSPAGWSIGAWPWGDDAGRSGHGVPRVRDMTAAQALAVAWGGPSINRDTIVDLPALAALGDVPWLVDPTPTFVRLDTPGGPPFDAWAPWFRWLDAGRFVRPTGPFVWIDVGTPARYGPIEIARSLNYGKFGCGTGAWLNIKMEGAGPGMVVLPRVPDTDAHTDGTPDSGSQDTDQLLPNEHMLTVDLRPGESLLNRVSIVTQGKGVIGTYATGGGAVHWTGPFVVGDWTTAIAWSTTSSAWATATPVWTRAPAALPEADTDADSDTP